MSLKNLSFCYMHIVCFSKKLVQGPAKRPPVFRDGTVVVVAVI